MPNALGLLIGPIGGLILHRRCICHGGAWGMLPVWHLVERYGGSRLLGDILPHLVCRHCRRTPQIILSDSMYITHNGGPPPSWSVILFDPAPPLTS